MIDVSNLRKQAEQLSIRDFFSAEFIRSVTNIHQPKKTPSYLENSVKEALSPLERDKKMVDFAASDDLQDKVWRKITGDKTAALYNELLTMFGFRKPRGLSSEAKKLMDDVQTLRKSG